jgi:hypothetical protein
MYISNILMHIILPFYSRFINWVFPPKMFISTKKQYAPLVSDISAKRPDNRNLPHFTDLTATQAVTNVNIFPPILTVNLQYLSSIIRTVAGFKAHRHEDWVDSNSLTYNMADGRLSLCRNYCLPQVNVHC